MRGATSPLPKLTGWPNISIHAPRAGSDASGRSCPDSPWNFNPRSPCGERPANISCSATVTEFQSTLPVRGATVYRAGCVDATNISIHAPRAGSDLFMASNILIVFISIHAPRAGSDSCRRRRDRTVSRFQSTLPVRGATRQHLQSPRPLRISIHAPRAGSDPLRPFRMLRMLRFQSTLPVRGATSQSARSR